MSSSTPKERMSKHTEHSSFREKLVEHLFIGELLKQSWRLGRCDVEVAKPEVDNAGYDLILETHGFIRHVQLKASYLGSKTARQNLHIRLGDKPSGCVIWIYFDEDSMRPGITPCVIKVAATYAVAIDRSHSPAASAGA